MNCFTLPFADITIIIMLLFDNETTVSNQTKSPTDSIPYDTGPHGHTARAVANKSALSGVLFAVFGLGSVLMALRAECA